MDYKLEECQIEIVEEEEMFNVANILVGVGHLLVSEKLQYVQVNHWIIFMKSEFDFIFEVWVSLSSALSKI